MSNSEEGKRNRKKFYMYRKKVEVNKKIRDQGRKKQQLKDKELEEGNRGYI